MTISRKIIGGYAVILVLLALVTSVSFYAINQTQTAYNHFLNVDERLLESANELRSVTFAQQTYVRGILLYPKLLKLNQSLLQTNDRQFRQIFEKMRSLIENSEELDLVNEMASLQEQLKQAEHNTIRLSLEQKHGEALDVTIQKFRPLSLALIEKAGRFYERQSKLLYKG
ncbi:MAG: MCP four helix bundle domain-containing protein, partial [Nitrosospira sp.]